MKPGKHFDCVQMKTGIQERLLREIAELGRDSVSDNPVNTSSLTCVIYDYRGLPGEPRRGIGPLRKEGL